MLPAAMILMAPMIGSGCPALRDSLVVYSEIRLHAAARFTHEWMLRPILSRFAPNGAVGLERISLHPIASKLECLTLVEVNSPSPHDNRILVGIVGSNVVDLAGIGGGELRILTSLLDLRVKDQDSALRVARYFAWLADPNGADSVLVADDARRQESLVAIPADTVMHRPWGTLGVRVSAASRSSPGSGHWDLFTYAFEFAADGRLLSWTICETLAARSRADAPSATDFAGVYAAAKTC